MEELLVRAGLDYSALRALHIFAVMISGGLFLFRGMALQLGARWVMAAPLRHLSYAIDTVLLAAALLLLAFVPWSSFRNGWLAVKLLLLVFYVVAGSIALKRGRTQRQKRLAFIVALVLFACIYGIARSHDPLGPLQALTRLLP